jgi:Ca2+-binding RTX toxin-like protein
MVTFVAFDQVEINHLLELGHIADTGPASFSNQMSTSFVITQGNVKFFIGGNNLSYQGPIPASGNVTSLRITVDGDNAYKFSNFSYTVSQAFNLLDRPPEQAVKLILDGNDSITGSRLADTLFGYDGIDTIRGGAGNDFINGGNGNDRLFGDAGNDTILGGAGADTMLGGVGDDSLNGGNDNDKLFGDAGKDTLVGGAGADQLHGSLGNDVLRGDAGPDRYYLETALNKTTNVDRVAFGQGDKLVLDLGIFDELFGGSKLKGSEFNIGTAAETPEHRINYNPGNGILLYDEDGLGGAAGVKFAVLLGSPDDVDRLDFLLVA